MKRWFLHRLRERTTWLSVLGMLGLFGIRLEPELQEYILQGLIAASCIVAFLFPESDLAKKDELPPIELVARSESDTGGRVRESRVSSGGGSQEDSRVENGWNG